MFKKILFIFMCVALQNTSCAGDVQDGNKEAVQDANKDLRYKNYSEVKKWVGGLNPKCNQKTRVIYKKAPEGRELPKSRRARILPKGVKVSQRVNFEDKESLLFNHGGELNFLNDFFSDPKHKGYPLDTLSDENRKKDFSNGIQITPERSSSRKHPFLNHSSYIDRRFFYAFHHTRSKFLAYYKETAFEKIYTPVIAYFVLPTEVPYAQDNPYEAALSWQDKEKIKGMYIISPFYKEKNKEIIEGFKMLGIDLPAEEARLLKESKEYVNSVSAHLEKLSYVLFKKNDTLETKEVITQESAQIVKQEIEKILKRQTKEILDRQKIEIDKRQAKESIQQPNKGIHALTREFRAQKLLEEEIEAVIKRQIEDVIHKQTKEIVNQQTKEIVRREIERMVNQQKEEMARQQVEEIVQRQEYLNALHPITECFKRPSKKIL